MQFELICNWHETESVADGCQINFILVNVAVDVVVVVVEVVEEGVPNVVSIVDRFG